MLTFRNITPEDRAILDSMIAKDSDHYNEITSDFFMVPPDPCMTTVVEDKDGVAMYLRFDPEPQTGTVRIHIQFHNEQEYRTGHVLFEGFPIVARQLYLSGVSRVVFETINPKLAAFCMAKFGFERVGESTDYALYLIGERELSPEVVH